MCHRAGAWSCPSSSWDIFSFICAAKDLFHVVGRPVASFSMETPANVYPNPHPPKPLPLTTLFLAFFRHSVCVVSPHTHPYPVPTSTHKCCQHSQFKLFFTYHRLRSIININLPSSLTFPAAHSRVLTQSEYLPWRKF